ncbi:MAG: cell wall hydrolase [Blautia sp.]|nr:cell wall hydrolase [Blautia sp.]
MKGVNLKRNVKKYVRKLRKNSRSKQLLQRTIILAACILLAIAIPVASKAITGSGKKSVYASSGYREGCVPYGMSGLAVGVKGKHQPGSQVTRIGTSAERVMVGQRVKTVEKHIIDFDLSSNMIEKVNDLNNISMNAVQNTKIMSDKDYDTLLRIVESEAGTEDIKGRVLVANVIMNRVRHPEFPDSIYDVVWERNNGVPQFQPTSNGTIYYVTVTDETKEAVRQAIEGVDYSEGALFFIQKDAAEEEGINWFEKNLKRLFKHGVHEFYTYPEENETNDAINEDVNDDTDKEVQSL